MQQMGNNGRQVISITHLPQIAAMGKVHYKVYKKQIGNNTETHMTMLNEQERVNEIANILSGSVVTDAAISNARELLKNNGNEK
jgi:DNA repair protein RecN (Recombination protein N)